MASNILDQILGGISGAGQGLEAQQQYRQRQEEQSRKTAQRATIARLWKPAQSGDANAQAELVSSIPEMASLFDAKPVKPERQYDAQRGGVVDVNANTFTPTPGVTPAPKAPVPGSPEWHAMKVDEARIGAQDGYHAPQHDQFTSTPATDAQGVTHLYRFNTHTGQYEDSGLGPKPGAGGAGGAQDRRSKSYVDLMVHSLPTMQEKADSVRPAAISFVLAHPTAGNYLLSDDEQQYMQAARDFLAGVLHQESGARLTASQVEFGMQRYVPLAGDSQEVRAQKLAAAQQVMEERRADYGGVGGQHPQTPHLASPSTLTPEQQHRAQVEPEYAAFLRAQGKL